MAASPTDYPWSSYRYHAEGCVNEVIQDHRLYLELGATQIERQLAYRELFRHQLDDKELAEIRISVNGGLVLGEERFKDEIEGVVARRVRPGRGGRPRKTEGRGVGT
jgi:putative transposase